MNSQTSSTSSIPLPKARLGTRIVLPTVIVGGALAVLAWSSWRAWAPLTVVHAVAVIVRPIEIGSATASHASASGARATGPVVQAPGWIEPSPFALTAAALVPGVVREVLVLEGDHVSKGQPVARLINDEQVLALRKAAAEREIKSAEHDVLADEYARKSKLLASGGVSEGEVARLGHRVRAAKAALELATASQDEAALALARTEIHAPAAGIVMARLAAPGTRVGMDPASSAILQFFDPAQLQVRTDVPLADAGRLAIGQTAEVTVDAFPGVVIRGHIIRLVQQADIAKNTLQVKVRLDDPPIGLVPDMLARVKIQTGAKPATGSESSPTTAASNRTEVAVLESALGATTATSDGTRTGEVRVVVDVRDGVGQIEMRAVVCALTAGPEGWTAAYKGIRPGDLVVLGDSPPTTDGQTVRVSSTPVGKPTKGDHDGHN